MKFMAIIPIIFMIGIIIITPGIAEANKPTITKQGPTMYQRLHVTLPRDIVLPDSFTMNNVTITHTTILQNTTSGLVGKQNTLSFNTLEIIRSQVCNIEAKFNMSSSCPKISELMKYDTSNQLISGRFIPTSNGDYIRTEPQVKNNWLYYTKPIVCIECHTDLFRPDVTKQIIIEPKSFTYINKTETSTDGSYQTFKNRYFAGCNIATIAYSPKLLNETIHYMLNNCVGKITNDNTTNNRILHAFLPQDSIQWRFNQYLNNAMNQSIGNCINFHCDIKSYGNKFHS